jgi:uncharacterized protein YraI
LDAHARRDLDGQLICVPDNLRKKISFVKLGYQGTGYVVRFDISIQNSSFHILDYNPFINGGDGSSYFMYIDMYDMNRLWFKLLITVFLGFVVSLTLFFKVSQVAAFGGAQAQSGVFATVTYTEPINVRGGPSTVYYPIVGRVFPGDVFPALGVSPGHEWVKIAFPDAPGGEGWLYAIYVSIEGGELQIAEPPPTAMPLATATINPTFAAAFIFQPTSTRMPTFTPPPALEIPQFNDEVVSRPSGIPTGWLVASLLLIGILGYLITLVLTRR